MDFSTKFSETEDMYIFRYKLMIFGVLLPNSVLQVNNIVNMLYKTNQLVLLCPLLITMTVLSAHLRNLQVIRENLNFTDFSIWFCIFYLIVGTVTEKQTFLMLHRNDEFK